MLVFRCGGVPRRPGSSASVTALEKLRFSGLGLPVPRAQQHPPADARISDGHAVKNISARDPIGRHCQSSTSSPMAPVLLDVRAFLCRAVLHLCRPALPAGSV
jgi:hypothetical protein